MIGIIVGIGGISATLIGADFGHNVFVTELQPWRALWLLTLTAHLFVVPLLATLFGSAKIESLTRATLLTALFSLFASKFVGSIMVAAPMMAVAASGLAWQWQTRRPLSTVPRLFCSTAIALTAAGTALFLIFGFQLLFEEWREHFWSALEAAAIGGTVLGLMVIATTKQIKGMRGLAWAATAAILLVPVVLLLWDQRTPWTKFVESEPPIPADLANAIPPHATVYWEGGLEFLWFDWKRSDYISCSQGTGAVFFRDTALEYEHRLDSLWPLRTLDFTDSDLCPNLDSSSKPDRTRADLQGLCAREPGLDYAVLTRPVEDVKAVTWIPPAPHRVVGIKDGRVSASLTGRFYIYSCASVI
jgi:hypothetical protein